MSAVRTWSLSALPMPVTAFFTSCGRVLRDGEAGLGRDEHDRAGGPGDVSALTWFRLHATRSTATAAG